MPRYIDADKLHYKRVWIAAKKDGAVNDAVVVFAGEIDKLALAPRMTNVVEVVRCKDCAWASRADNGELRCGHDNRGLYLGFVPENWYCADGERKEKTDDTNT